MNRENFDSSNERKGHALYPFSSHRLLDTRGVSKICRSSTMQLRAQVLPKWEGKGPKQNFTQDLLLGPNNKCRRAEFDVVARLKLGCCCGALAVDRGLRCWTELVGGSLIWILNHGGSRVSSPRAA